MADEQLRASWSRTDRHLRDALARHDFPDDVRATAFEYIEHNELGVAFEYLTAVLVESGAELSEAARHALSSAASEMGLQDSAGWQRLAR